MAADLKTSAYVVLSTLKHDDKTYRKGTANKPTIVRLTDKEALPLLTLKTVEPAK